MAVRTLVSKGIQATLLSVVATGALIAPLSTYAKEAIPNLVGKWKVISEGGVLLKGKQPSTITHHAGTFSKFTAEANITEQQGRVVLGIFKSPRSTEKFIGVISIDGKILQYADQDGTMQGKIISPDRMISIYSHVTSTESVVGAATWERIK